MAVAETSLLVPPHSLDAEQAVLGGILLAEKRIYGVVIDEGLKPGDFYRPQHGAVFAAMLALYDAGEPIDDLTLKEHLKARGKLEDAGGEALVDELAAAAPVAGHVRQYARIVRDHALERRLQTTCWEVLGRIANREAPPRDLVDQAERAILEVGRDDKQKDFVGIEQVLHDALDRFHALSQQKTSLTGTPSGFRHLDELTGGFQPGNLIVLAARPGMGKSALVTNIAENAAIELGKPVALFSLEMSEAELAQRFVASQASIKGEELRRGKVDDRRWPKVLAACQKLSEAPLLVDDSSDVGTTEVRAKARRLHQQSADGLGLVIVDYLQLMRADTRIENRVQQVGEMSRGLKLLAKELDVPVIALSQLSRGVEQRHDKRPLLSDLRECVTGDTLVVLADGRRLPIGRLVGSRPAVVAVDERGRLVTARADRIWPVGRRPTFTLRLASGRTLRASAKHRVRAASGWRELHHLAVGERVALARRLPEPDAVERWSEDRVALLGQLIGDGSYLPHQPLRYTTASEQNSRAVRDAAEREFGSLVTRHPGRGSWHQLVLAGNGNRWHPRGVKAWLRELGIFGQRSYQKRVPVAAFRLGTDQLATLLRHLWATDGCVLARAMPDGRLISHVYYATSSPGLAGDVAALLLRLGIIARTTCVQHVGHRPGYHVRVSGAAHQHRFLEIVGAFGPRRAGALELTHLVAGVANTNVATLPAGIWDEVRSVMTDRGITHRAMTRLRGTAYGGTSHFRFAPSRGVIAEYAELLESPELAEAAASDLFWDKVVAIEAGPEEEVFDLTVPGPACWLADGIVSHNSGNVEQDSDLVMFIYRDEYYEKEQSEEPGVAEIILSKHRNGALGTVKLTFQAEYPRFRTYVDEDRFA